MPKFGAKMLYWNIFGIEFPKKYSLFKTFCEKVKMSKFRTKNTTLFKYFKVRIWKNCSPV